MPYYLAPGNAEAVAAANAFDFGPLRVAARVRRCRPTPLRRRRLRSVGFPACPRSEAYWAV